MSLPSAGTEPVAIIGMACRFPGASSPEEFWEMLRDGVDAITEVPPERFDIDPYYDPEPAKPGKTNSRWGGFIKDVDRFDAQFFGIAPREVEAMDPQQRLLLELAWEAIENAGLPIERAQGTDTGVFVGITTHDYFDMQMETGVAVTPHTGTGMAFALAANRVSYNLDLHGPSVALDTACSSSLVAAHLACQSLRRGECSAALVGGVNLILTRTLMVQFSQARMLSSDGRCKAFDASADGFVRGEGCGMVVLKRLSDALRDGDRIHAVIRGSATNQDGRTNGVTAPNGLAQQAMLRDALKDAKLRPEDIDYVEAHGTGTALGDPIEVEALRSVLLEGRSPDQPCIIGSGKTNVGHLEAGAGIVGIIRAALILEHRQVPPHLHLRELNPLIRLEGTPLRIASSELEPLKGNGRPLHAGVNSFGFGGANCHLILEEAPRSESRENLETRSIQVLTLSGKTPEALNAQAESYRTFLLKHGNDLYLHDVCYTAGVHRTHHPERLALVADSRGELLDQLDAFLGGEDVRSVIRGSADSAPGKLAFVFAGMGTQWVGMGQELLAREPVFRAAIERCDAAMSSYVDWSLLEELARDGTEARLDDIGVLQPVLFAMAVALSDLWRSWGIEPDAVVGHSVGEVAAACVAGALTLDQAARIVCGRGDALRLVAGQGAMLAVGLPAGDAAELIQGYEGRVSVGVMNSPTATVLSGEPDAIQEIAARLDGTEIFHRRVNADIAFHGPQMDLLRERFLDALQELQPEETSIPFYSTVTATRLEGRDLDAQYWIRNLREPVSFAQTVEDLVRDGCRKFIEISPHPVLLHSIEESVEHAGVRTLGVPSLRRNDAEQRTMLQSLAHLHTRGHQVKWACVYPEGRLISVPTYPWQHERFWLTLPSRPRRDHRSPRPGHRTSLLGEPVSSAAHADTRVWEIDLDLETFPYLADHRVVETFVFPGVGFAEMGFEVAHELGLEPCFLEGAEYYQGLVLPADSSVTVQTVAVLGASDSAQVKFFSRDASSTGGRETWIEHAALTIRYGAAVKDSTPVTETARADIEARCPDDLTPQRIYGEMRSRGLEYGPAFQGLTHLWRGDGEAVGDVTVPESIADELSDYHMHPALFDASGQPITALVPLEPYLPAAVEFTRVYNVHQEGLWAHSIRRFEDRDEGFLVGDCFVYNRDDELVLEVRGLRTRRRHPKEQGMLDRWLCTIQWETLAPPDRDAVRSLPPQLQGSWLLLAGSSDIGAQLAALLEAHGAPCVIASPGETYEKVGPRRYRLNPACPEDFRRLIRSVSRDRLPLCGIVHLWSLEDGGTSPTSATAQDLGSVSLMHLVQAWASESLPTAPQLWLVTRGAQSIGKPTEDGLAQSPVLGLARVLANEHPELKCKCIDLDPTPASDADIQSLFTEMLSNDGEEEILIRAGTRHVPRLVPLTSASSSSEELRTLIISGDEPYRLATSKPGVLDNLHLRRIARPLPTAEEVEIRVKATGLNFRDVMSAMGILPGYPDGLGPLGYECSGVITRIGDGVTDLRVGDEVLAFAYHAFGSYVLTPAHLVRPKPARLSFEEAATIPITFLTAYYALHHLARVEEGERVLIHAAAGGVGLAAIQIAQAVGAEIFATAGSPVKREFLRSLGVQHITDSRSLDFAREVMELTDGQGVDVVLNSLAGEFIPKSLAVLAPYGRFLELGRRDIYQNSQLGLEPFQRNLSFFAIDLDKLYNERPAFANGLFRQVMDQMEAGALEPLPHTVYPIAETESAFRYMAQAKHIGKVVVSLEADTVTVRAPSGPQLRSDATYLITGGLGALGLVVADWMVDRGARCVLLIGRRGASPENEARLDELRKKGCRVTTARVDVTRADEVQSLLREIESSLPPLRGIVHAAGVLDDGVLLQLDRERYERVIAPKVAGAWNLHLHTRGMPLDFFVLFSSVAATLGNAGQGNYAAANQFLDALAHYRQSLGLPGLSVAWGPWSGAGMAVTSEVLQRFARQGIETITPHQGTTILTHLLAEEASPPAVAVLPVDWNTYFAGTPGSRDRALLRQFQRELSETLPERSIGSMRDQLARAVPKEREQVLESYLADQVGRALGMAARRFGPSQSLVSLGLDSLMAVELRSRIRMDLSVDISSQVFLDGSNVTDLASRILAQVTPVDAAVPDGSTEDEELEELTL